MLNWANERLTTWGRVRHAHVASMAPADEAGLQKILAAQISTGNARGLITYGGGRCYGDAALDDGGRAIRTKNLDRILSFDPDTRDVVCEAGVTFRSLADEFFGQGYCFPVSAATSSVTAGGAFANDIHSKNHHAVGSFGNHAKWIDLVLADGRTLRCSRDENADLFFATLGGTGLTGTILRVCFTMLPVTSGAVDARYEPQPNLDAMLEAIDAARDSEDFLFGWLDVFARGAALGRGILEKGRFASDDGGAVPAPKPWTMKLAPPSILVRPAVLRWYTNRRFEAVPPAGKSVRLPLFPFLFPLDHVTGFNKVYGSRGFYAIHAGFPAATQALGIRAMLTEIAEAQAGSMTAVAKPMRGPGEGLLSFPVRGMAFAVDLPARGGTPALHRRLEAIALDHGGRLYLAKDALMAPETFAAMFPNLDRFRAAAAMSDPEGLFQSDLSRRLNLRPVRG